MRAMAAGLVVVMLTTGIATAPVVSADNKLFDPLQSKMNFWGYQKLMKSVGLEQTRQVAGMIEFSKYPDFIKALIVVESAWNYEVRSWAGAIGLMQIRMIAAGEVDPQITEEQLFDPVVNVHIGITIFEDHMDHFRMRNEFEHWALTSYNRGRGGMYSLRLDPPRTDYSMKVVALSRQM